MRLNLFIRVVVKAAPSLKYALFAAMDAPQSWMKAVWLDLLWIKPLSKAFEELDTFQDWIREISLRPHFFKVHFKKVAAEVKANQLIPITQCDLADPTGEPIQCRACTAVFFTHTARACHEWSQHRIKSQARAYVGGSNVCRVCLKQFTNRARAVEQLQKAKHCLNDLIRCVPPLPADVVARLDEDAATIAGVQPKISKNVVRCRTAPRRIQGPLRPVEEEDSLLFHWETP